MKKFKKTNFILIILITITILSLLNSTLVTKQILSYTKLFIEKLFPSSFLFFTLSSLLIDYNAIQILSKLLKRNSSSFYVVMMSLISGFPSGSKYTKDLLDKNLITETTANSLIKYTHFPNPIFILGPVSLLFPSKTYCYKILFSLILSNLIIAIISRTKENNKITLPSSPTPSFSKALPRAITNSIKTILLIYGTSIFFFLISLFINQYLKLPLLEYVIINGIFDLTNGTFLTSLISNNTLRAIIIIFFFSFGGISVHMQTKSIISDTKINYRNFLLGRIYQTLISISIFLWIINI